MIRALELAEAGASLAPPEDRLWADDMRHPTTLVGLELEPAELDRRIEARVAAQVEQGVVAEAQAAWAQPLSGTARKVLGLEAFATLPLDEAVEAVVAASRRLARYQRKWLRRLPGAVTLAARPGPRGDRRPTSSGSRWWNRSDKRDQVGAPELGPRAVGARACERGSRRRSSLPAHAPPLVLGAKLVDGEPEGLERRAERLPAGARPSDRPRRTRAAAARPARRRPLRRRREARPAAGVPAGLLRHHAPARGRALGDPRADAHPDGDSGAVARRDRGPRAGRLGGRPRRRSAAR